MVDYLTFLYNDGKNIYTEGKVMSSRELVETQARTSGMVNGHELLEVGSEHRSSPRNDLASAESESIEQTLTVPIYPPAMIVPFIIHHFYFIPVPYGDSTLRA